MHFKPTQSKRGQEGPEAGTHEEHEPNEHVELYVQRREQHAVSLEQHGRVNGQLGVCTHTIACARACAHIRTDELWYSDSAHGMNKIKFLNFNQS
jgi:hypothetical protein